MLLLTQAPMAVDLPVAPPAVPCQFHSRNAGNTYRYQTCRCTAASCSGAGETWTTSMCDSSQNRWGPTQPACRQAQEHGCTQPLPPALICTQGRIARLAPQIVLHATETALPLQVPCDTQPSCTNCNATFGVTAHCSRVVGPTGATCLTHKYTQMPHLTVGCFCSWGRTSTPPPHPHQQCCLLAPRYKRPLSVTSRLLPAPAAAADYLCARLRLPPLLLVTSCLRLHPRRSSTPSLAGCCRPPAMCS